MKKLTKAIIILVVIILVCIPIIADVMANRTLKKIDFKDYDGVVNDTANYAFSLVYIGKEDKDTNKNIKKIINEHKLSDTGVDGYFIDIDSLKKDELEKLTGASDVKTAYLFISNGELIKAVNEKLSKKDLTAYVDEYTVYTNNKLNEIREDLVNYKVVKNAKEYAKLVEAKKTVTMAVFGRDTCFYCNQFKPVYNTVAEEYGLDIYYFDSDSYDSEEYSKIMDMGLVIPASCTTTGTEADLAKGFDTPLTLFTKNGKVVDCISGYTGKRALITKLKTVGMIKESE